MDDFILYFMSQYAYSERELIERYFCSVLALSVTEENNKGLGGKFEKKYILVPDIDVANKYLKNTGVDGFFGEEGICRMGLTRSGFVEFVRNLDREIQSAKTEDILEL